MTSPIGVQYKPGYNNNKTTTKKMYHGRDRTLQQKKIFH